MEKMRSSIQMSSFIWNEKLTKDFISVYRPVRSSLISWNGIGTGKEKTLPVTTMRLTSIYGENKRFKNLLICENVIKNLGFSFLPGWVKLHSTSFCYPTYNFSYKWSLFHGEVLGTPSRWAHILVTSSDIRTLTSIPVISRDPCLSSVS